MGNSLLGSIQGIPIGFGNSTHACKSSTFRYLGMPPAIWRGFQALRLRGTLDEMISRRKARNTKKPLTLNSEQGFPDRRQHLTSREVEQLIEAAKGNRNESRDRCLLMLIFRHGLRVSAACVLKLDRVDADSRVLHVSRLKRVLSTDHPLRGDELRAIAAWLKEGVRIKAPAGVKTFFISEQRKPPHRSTVNLLLQKYCATSLPLRARGENPSVMQPKAWKPRTQQPDVALIPPLHTRRH